MSTNAVVAHFLDGHLVKGVCLNLDPRRQVCHVQTRDEGTVSVDLAGLKALYYVRSLDGDPARRDLDAVDPGDPRRTGARVIEIFFRDGEHLVGITPRYPPPRSLFYVLPADEGSNNIRILVNQAGCNSLRAI